MERCQPPLFDGSTLHGDDFDIEGIRQWFQDEAEGYADLVEESDGDYTYHYHGMNKRLGFRHLGNVDFPEALGFGAAYGDEFAPLAARLKRLTIVDPSDKFIRSTVCGVPCRYTKPSDDGSLPFGDNTFDLATCFGVLHHIPNVSHVLSELVRCLKPDGFLLIREPIVSMGDWRKPRTGLTRRERGISRQWFLQKLDRIECEVVSASLFGFRPLVAGWNRLSGSSIYASQVGTLLDVVCSRLFSWNYRYHATSSLQRIRPTGIYFVLRKNGQQAELRPAA